MFHLVYQAFPRSKSPPFLVFVLSSINYLVCTKFQRQNYRIPWQISPGKIIERKLSIVRVYVYTYKRAFSGRDSCMLHCIIYDPVAWQKPS